jgi:hypothetical protein
VGVDRNSAIDRWVIIESDGMRIASIQLEAVKGLFHCGQSALAKPCNPTIVLHGINAICA